MSVGGHLGKRLDEHWDNDPSWMTQPGGGGMEQEQQSDADEVRARRLVVVDDAGAERIMAEIAGPVAESRIALPGLDGHAASADLYAAEHDGRRDRGRVLDLQFWADGEVQAGMDIWLEEGRWK
jgi:hypothetical protein